MALLWLAKRCKASSRRFGKAITGIRHPIIGPLQACQVRVLIQISWIKGQVGFFFPGFMIQKLRLRCKLIAPSSKLLCSYPIVQIDCANGISLSPILSLNG